MQLPAGIILDLDGTLYSGVEMDRANRVAIEGAIAEWQHLTKDEARELVEIELGAYSKSVGRPSLYGVALKVGVPDEVVERWQIAEVKPREILQPDPELANLLTTASSASKLALLTNTRTSLATEAIDALGISASIFLEIRGGEKLRQPKPSPSDLLEIAEKLALPPDKCISVGDRWAVDLQPAADIGMMTHYVEDRDDLARWLRKLIGEDSLRGDAIDQQK